MADSSGKSAHGRGGNNMLSAVLEHYARYQNKKQKKRGGVGGGDGEDSFTGTSNQEIDSIYRSSINGRYFLNNELKS